MAGSRPNPWSGGEDARAEGLDWVWRASWDACCSVDIAMNEEGVVPLED